MTHKTIQKEEGMNRLLSRLEMAYCDQTPRIWILMACKDNEPTVGGMVSTCYVQPMTFLLVVFGMDM